MKKKGPLSDKGLTAVDPFPSHRCLSIDTKVTAKLSTVSRSSESNEARKSSSEASLRIPLRVYLGPSSQREPVHAKLVDHVGEYRLGGPRARIRLACCRSTGHVLYQSVRSSVASNLRCCSASLCRYSNLDMRISSAVRPNRSVCLRHRSETPRHRSTCVLWTCVCCRSSFFCAPEGWRTADPGV